jgi:DNA-binding GntR family transcriptional regulator
VATTGLHDRVLYELGSAIVGGEVRVGQMLRMEELDGPFGMSRSVVRKVGDKWGRSRA